MCGAGKNVESQVPACFSRVSRPTMFFTFWLCHLLNEASLPESFLASYTRSFSVRRKQLKLRVAGRTSLLTTLAMTIGNGALATFIGVIIEPE